MTTEAEILAELGEPTLTLPVCPNCGSLGFDKGYVTPFETVKEKWRCSSCGKWFFQEELFK